MTPADLAVEGVKGSWIQIKCQHEGRLLVLWADPRATAGQIARSLLAEIQFEPVDIGLAPKGANAMALVGLPVWMWVDSPGRTTWGPTTVSAGGVSLTAQVESVVWDMGDGTNVSCGRGTVWKHGMGGSPSPTCGHAYKRQGDYTVLATSRWVARWSGYGQSGTIPFQLTSSRQLDVGEIQVIVTRG